ncbi:MAG: type 4a pilus biogenesis protein PilO [Gaiellaceae bacterium]
MKKNVNLRLPKQGKLVLVGVGAILVLLIGWMLLLAPKQKQIASLHAETAAAQQQIADDLSRAATARSASSAPTIKVADVYKLATAMPSITDMPDLLLELDQVAKSSGVTLDSITPSQPQDSNDGYMSLALNLSVTGNFYGLTDLLFRLRNLVYVRSGALEANGRIFSIDGVQLTPSQSSISASISLTTYVYGSGSSTSSSTATTPGTTTSTTTTPSSGPSATGATP